MAFVDSAPADYTLEPTDHDPFAGASPPSAETPADYRLEPIPHNPFQPIDLLSGNYSALHHGPTAGGAEPSWTDNASFYEAMAQQDPQNAPYWRSKMNEEVGQGIGNIAMSFGEGGMKGGALKGVLPLHGEILPPEAAEGAATQPTADLEGATPRAQAAVMSAPKDRSAYYDERAYKDSIRAAYIGPEGEKIASSRETPFGGDLPPVGTWRVSPIKGAYGHDIEHLEQIPLQDLHMPELDTAGKLDVLKRGDDERYAEWIKQGLRPPPVEAVEMENGKLGIVDGHRRALAAQLAGKDSIEAWVSHAVPSPSGYKAAGTGKPIMTGLTYEIAHGEPFNRPVAAEPGGPAGGGGPGEPGGTPSPLPSDVILEDFFARSAQRQYSLQRTNPEAGEMFRDREVHRYDIKGPDGENAGKAQVLYDPNNTKSVTLRSISSPGLQKNTIGTVGMRDLVDQFKELYPEAETVDARRATGAGQQAYTSRPMSVPLKQKSVSMYNPPDAPPRPFSRDYPQGAPTNAATGRISTSIEGDPLQAGHIAGRTYPNEPDVGISPADYSKIVREATGKRPQSVDAARLGKDAAGVYRSASKQIQYLSDLSDEDATRVIAHEMGHMLDIGAGTKEGATQPGGLPRIATRNTEVNAQIEKELRNVYHDQNSVVPRSQAKKLVSPESRRYTAEETPYELMAEGIRSYMTNPNYFKSVAPTSAMAIRKFINTHPKLSKVIQFNAIGLPILVGGAAALGKKDEQ